MTLFGGDSTSGYSTTVVAVDLATRESRMLTVGGFARYLDPGFLIFCRDAALWAAPIESETGELVAPARSIQEVQGDDGPLQGCSFETSRSGNLLYIPRRETGLSRVVWVALDGTVEPVTPEIKNFLLPIPSLDGRQVSVQVVTSEGYEQWILDLSTGSWSRPAQRGSQTSAAEWLPPAAERSPSSPIEMALAERSSNRQIAALRRSPCGLRSVHTPGSTSPPTAER
jgi:hypothetical protein